MVFRLRDWELRGSQGRNKLTAHTRPAKQKMPKNARIRKRGQSNKINLMRGTLTNVANLKGF